MAKNIIVQPIYNKVQTNPSTIKVNVYSFTGPTSSSGGGATTFTQLTDTVSSYTGEALKLVRVRAAETGLEFFAAPYLTTNQSISLSGDVTGSGATAITTSIATHAVTYAKLQQIAANTLIGNPTSSLANAQGIGLGVGLAFSGSNITNAGVTTITSGSDISVSATTGAVVVSNTSTLATVTSRGNTTGTGLILNENGALSGSYSLYLKRNNDSTPLGYYILAQNAAANTDIFSVDVTGNVIANSFALTGGTALQILNGDGTTSTVLSAIRGGTGLNSYAIGDIIYANSTTTLTALNVGTDTQVLTLTGGLPTWQNAAAGFSNPMTTFGDLIYENASPLPDRIPGNITPNKRFLTQTGTGTISGIPLWDSIISSDISGIVVGGDLSGTLVNPTVSSINGNLIPVNAVGALTNDGIGNLSWTSTPSTLSGMSDVNISSLADGDLLQYRTSDSKWHNFVLSSDATINNTGALILTNSAVTGQLLTGYVSSSGAIAASDSILSAIEKLNGNMALLTFLGLTDAPHSYAGQALKLVRVNAGETALEFVVSGGGGGSTTLSGLTDVTIVSIADGQLLQYRTSDNTWHNFTLSGDATISNVGALNIGAGKVTNTMLAGSIAASKLIGTDIATVGTITTGVWNATKISLTNGGTNADLSATGGSGNYLKQSSVGAAITVGTIPASDISSGAALTKVDDTNVTLSLGGSPTTALLAATSLTLGWTGTLADGRIASSTNWNTAYTNRISSLTVIGSSGAATLISNVLNIPTYTLAGLGGISGSLTSGRIPIANGASSLTDYSNFTYTGAILSVNGVTLKSPNGSGSGDPNLFLGTSAGVTSPTNGYNSAFGSSALGGLTTGQFNTGIGAFALAGNTTANQNTAIGYIAMGNNTVTGGNNVAIGRAALQNLSSGSLNVVIGDAAGNASTTGSQNTFVGRIAGLTQTTASDNTFIGYSGGSLNTSGNQNTFVGSGAGSQNTTGSDNVYLGFQAAGETTIQTGSKNVFIGSQVIGENQLNSDENVSIGYQALSNAASTTGSFNQTIGSHSGGLITTGQYNLLHGHRVAGSDDPTVAVTSGSQNIALGYRTNVPSSTADGQLSIQNAIYGTGNSLNVTGDAIALGNIGLYVKSPTARLHIIAGNATTGPLKLTSGTVVTTIAAGVQDGLIEYDGTHLSVVIGSTRYQLDQQTGGGVVTSVSGTANRITSTGGTTPIIDIDSSYVGQASITTVGTIGTGTWHGSVIGAVYGGAGTINGVLKANGSGVVSAAVGSDINTTFGSQAANTFYGSPDGSSGNPSFRAISRNDLTSVYTKVGQVFTESWANLTNWTNVGTPSAAVSGGYLTLSGTASTSTNYVKNNSYGKFNLEAATVSWTEVVGTVGASTSGIGFGLVSQNTLSSTAFANSMMVNIELSTTNTGVIKWYFGSGTTFTVAQTSPAILVPVAGDVLNITLVIYPDKYELNYNINGGVSTKDTLVAYTGGQEGPSGYTTVTHNAAAFSFFNVGGGSSHKVGAVTVKSLHNKNANILLIGNSIFSGYGCANLYNRAATKMQKRTYSTIEINARPSNSILDINTTEIAAYNATKLILLACSNDLAQNSVATVEANLATTLTALAGISNAAAPSGYSIANGNLILGTELLRSAVASSITTYNSDLVTTYGAANIINFNTIGNTGGTALPIPGATGVLAYSFDAIHPNDYANGLMADEMIRFLDITRKDVYENEDVAITNIASPKGYNTVLNHTSGITIISSMNSSREKYLSFSGYGTTNGAAMTAAIRASQAGGENVILGQTTAGFGIWLDKPVSNTYGATRRFLLDYSGALTLTQGVQTSAWTSGLIIIPGAHTGFTTATEFISRDFRGATQTWIDGTTTIQRFNYFKAFTTNKTTTSATFTDIYNTYAEKSIAGSGVTFTRNWGIGTDGNLQVQGSAYIGGSGVAPTAYAHFAAGTTSIAPNRFTSGSLTTGGNILAGNMEFLTDDYYLTITTGTARKNITLWDTLGTSGRMPYVTTNGRLIDDASLIYDTTNGIQTTKNLKLTVAGGAIYIKQGSNATCGRATLVSGTVTVNTTAVVSADEIFITDRGGTVTNLGTVYISAVVDNTSFTITSTNILDASNVSWFIIKAA